MELDRLLVVIAQPPLSPSVSNNSTVDEVNIVLPLPCVAIPTIWKCVGEKFCATFTTDTFGVSKDINYLSFGHSWWDAYKLRRACWAASE